MKLAMRWILLVIGGLVTVSAYSQKIDKKAELAKTLERLNDERAKRIAAHQAKSGRLRIPPGVLLVDISPNGIPLYKAPLNIYAAKTTGVTELQNGTEGINLRGKGMTVGVWDAGRVVNHVELGDRILYREAGNIDTHASHTTGTILASGVNALAKGMAPLATGKTWKYDNDYQEMLSQITPDKSGMLLSNHSYGSLTGWFRSGGQWYWAGDTSISWKEDFRFGLYNPESETIDRLASLAPYYTMVWAAGNDRTETGSGEVPPDGNEGTGYDCIIPEAVAKNCITVGSINRVTNYTGPSSIVQAIYSSWGPTDDGRIKPDLVADGNSVYSLSGVGTNLYGMLSGTSMATANATGSLLLLQELQKRLHGNNPMRSSTLKALAIHTTKEAGRNPGPDYEMGWGLLDVQHAAQLMLHEDDINVIIREVPLDNDQTYAMDLHPVANQKITATIVWTDLPGNPPEASLDPETRALVNDLDLKITDDDGNEFFPWILDPANPSAGATKGINDRDNVEKIEFELPEQKTYHLTVTHKGGLLDEQYFSLIVSYTSVTPAPKTFYWIGGNGNWSDGAHWAATTGGTALGEIPGASDYVIVDDNSGYGSSINLDADATCGSLTWLSEKPFTLSMKGNKLSLTKTLTIASDSFKTKTKGVFAFIGEGALNMSSAGLEQDTLEFSGNYVVNGDLDVATLRITGGEFSLTNATLRTGALIGYGAEMDLTGTTIEQTPSIDLQNIDLRSNRSLVTATPNMKFMLDNSSFAGTIDVPAGSSLALEGSGTIDSLLVRTTATLRGEHFFNYLKVFRGAVLNFMPELTTTVSTFETAGDENFKVRLQSISSGNAKLKFNKRIKYCYDYLIISNVDATGNGVVTAGVHSILTDAYNWLKLPCDDVLFADFSVQYTCEHGYAIFSDISTGPVTSWSWDFGDPTSSENFASGKEVLHVYAKEGVYTVTLTISDGTQRVDYQRIIDVSPNSIVANVIEYRSGVLTSNQMADSYQWYLNGEKIENATEAEYASREAGAYTLYTTTGNCNFITAPFIILSAEEQSGMSAVYPNPANNQLTVSFHKKAPLHYVKMRDALGKCVIDQSTSDSSLLVSTQQLSPGMYLLEADGTRTRVVVKH